MAVEFDDNAAGARTVRPQRVGAVTRAVMSLGLAKTPKGAQVPLILIALAAVALSIYLVFFSSQAQAPQLTQEQRDTIEIELARGR